MRCSQIRTRSLARLEAQLAVAALTEVLPGLVRCGAELEYLDSFLVRGPAKLEIIAAA